MDLRFDLFFMQKKNSIEKIFSFHLGISCRRSNQHSNFICVFFEYVERLIAVVDEIGKLKKVSWGITTNTELGKNNQVSLLFFCPVDPVNDLFYILFKIADVIILLC